MLAFNTILDWCDTEKREFWEYMLADDMQERQVSEAESLAVMEKSWVAMQETIDTYRSDRLSASGLVGAEGGRLEAYLADAHATPLSGGFTGEAMVLGLKMAESNACMRRIVAAPTAGACGIIPAVLIAYQHRFNVSDEMIIRALYVAGGIGAVIADRASIAGAQGGCQAEIGSASAMAAGALVYLQGGSNLAICHASAMALKGLLGLVCDPVAGLVEIPCVKRNVTGTANAIACADMAMAGIESRIPPDEVVDAMAEVGDCMDGSLKETAQGGLAATPTGQAIQSKFDEQ